MYDSWQFTMAEIAASCHVTPMTVYRNIRADRCARHRRPAAGHPRPRQLRHTSPVSAKEIESPWEQALSHVSSISSGPALDAALRVTLNFHPDRPAQGQPILEALAEDGVYLSQFVTGTSNGGLTAYPGGDRWRWESRIFDGAYDDAPAHERPVYGALNFRRQAGRRGARASAPRTSG